MNIRAIFNAIKPLQAVTAVAPGKAWPRQLKILCKSNHFEQFPHFRGRNQPLQRIRLGQVGGGAVGRGLGQQAGDA